MSHEYVAEGFYKLVTECDNGSVMMVMKHTPFTIIPDTANFKVFGMILLAKFLGIVLGINLVTVKQEKLFMLLLTTFVCIVLYLRLY